MVLEVFEEKLTYWELSNSLESMAERTGKSAITAVVMTALLAVEFTRLAFKLPPVDGFKPRIQTRC